MLSLVHRLFRRTPDSRHIAKERLQLVLAHDRSHISPETLDLLKDEIITVISKHIEIDRAHVAVSISRSADGNRLVANIPVLGARRARPTKNR
jgi:cell division topological specificity factor